MQLFIEWVVGVVDDVFVFDGWVVVDILCLVQYVFIVFGVEEFCCVIDIVQYYVVILWLDSYIGDGVFFVGYIVIVGELFVQYVELVFGFYCKVVDCVFDFYWCIVIEVVEVVVEEWCCVLQLEQLVEGFGVIGRIFWQEEIKFFCQIEKNVVGFKYLGWWCGGMVVEGWDF